MLVKKSIVERWYRTDSWVYKQFSYLFDNPLWEKDVPTGFTVCPYFWMSMFSFLLFRPFFVFPMRFGIIPLMKLFGKPIVALDKALLNFWKSLGFSGAGGSGFGIFLSLGLSVVGALICGGLYIIGTALWNEYPIFTYDPLGMFTFWSIASFVPLFTILWIHQKITRTECKTMNYLYVWLILFLIAVPIFVPHQAGSGVHSLFASVKDGLAWFFSGCWDIIKWVAAIIWYALCWSPKILKGLGIFIPIWLLGICVLVGVAFVGYLADKLLGKLDSNKKDDYRKWTTEEYWASNRSAWVNFLHRVLLGSDDYWHKGNILVDDENYNLYCNIGKYRAMAAREHRFVVFRRAIEILFKNDLENLKKGYPIINYAKWEELRKMTKSEYRFSYLRNSNVVEGIEILNTPYSINRIQDAIIEACQMEDISDLLNPLAAKYEAEDKARENRKRAKLAGWAHQTCLKFTHALGSFFKRIGKGIVSIVVNLWTFIVYLFMLLKAKKQGACPYFKFTDPSTNINNKS